MNNDPFLLKPNQTVELDDTTFPLEYLFRGLLIVGQPGSGKTQMVLVPLLRSILSATGTDPEDKAGLIIADPKGEFEPLIARLLKDAGRDEDLIVLKQASAYYNPLASAFMTSSEVVEKIIGFARHTNRNAKDQGPREDPYWDNALRSLLGAVVAATRAINSGELNFALINETFRRINRFPNASSAMVWMRERNLSEATCDALRDYLSLPEDKTRPCVATSMTNTINFWNSDPLRQLTTPSSSVPAIDPIDVIDQGKVLLLACTDASYGVSIAPLLVALKEHLFSAVLSRDKLEVTEEGSNWRPVNKRRPIFFIADEFQQYVTPDATMGELIGLDRMRSNRAGYIAATQNLSSLHSVLGSPTHATRLISLFSNQVFLANICPTTATHAEFICGKRRIKERQREMMPRLSSPHLFRTSRSLESSRNGTVIQTTRQVPRVDASTLAQMATGEYWLRLANGKVVHKKTKIIMDGTQNK